MQKLKPFLVILLSGIFLVACGGGSDSGSGSEPVVSDIPDGVYSGTATIMYSGPNVNTDPSEFDMFLTVTGQLEGQQQVVIRFARWSGSSAIIEPSNAFSIPSGPFTVENDFFGTCNVNETFEGTFFANTASGTASSTWACDGATDVITGSATFDVTHQDEIVAAKEIFHKLIGPTNR